MKISSIRELEKITNKIKKILLPGDTILLYGEIGVGKTTFTRLLINSYEKENKIKKSEVLSPTFNIIFEYEIKKFKIQHFPMEKLGDIHKALELPPPEKACPKYLNPPNFIFVKFF